MLDDVHSMHGRFMISVWPKFYVNTDNYKELKAAGHVYLLAEEDSLKDWLGHVESFYDAYSQGGIHPDRAREARKPPKTPTFESYYKKQSNKKT